LRAFLLTSGVAVLLVAALFHSVKAAGFILPATISASAFWCWRTHREYRKGESLSRGPAEPDELSRRG
jgi:hypothetical protein